MRRAPSSRLASDRWQPEQLPVFGSMNTLKPRSSAGVNAPPGFLYSVEVVLAVVGVKARVLELEGLQASATLRRRASASASASAPNACAKTGRVRRGAQLGDDVGGAGVGHLERRQQRHLGLLGERVGAAVPGEPAARARRAEAVGVVEQIGVAGRELLVAKRRHRAQCPATCRVGPPSCTARSLGGPYAWSGSWQVAHDIAPDADSVLSKNSCLPTWAAALERARRAALRPTRSGRRGSATARLVGAARALWSAGQERCARASVTAISRASNAGHHHSASSLNERRRPLEERPAPGRNSWG